MKLFTLYFTVILISSLLLISFKEIDEYNGIDYKQLNHAMLLSNLSDEQFLTIRMERFTPDYIEVGYWINTPTWPKIYSVHCKIYRSSLAECYHYSYIEGRVIEQFIYKFD